MKTNLLIQIISYLFLLLGLFACSDDENEDVSIEAASGLRVFDVGNENNSQDLRVFFNTNDNGDKASEYRILISKASGSLTLDQAEGMGADSYFVYTGSDKEPRLNLDQTILDTDGEAVVNDIEYKLYILAIPASEATEALLSEASDTFAMTDAILRDFYVSSNATHSVELFDGVTGEHIRSFVAAGLGGLAQTQEVIFLEDGSLLVTGLGSAALKRYDGSTGEFLGNFTNGYTLNQPTKTNIGPDGHLYVSQWHNTINPIVRFNLETGEFIDEVVPSLFQGMGQAWDSDGNFYVVSWGLGKLLKYNASFELLSETTSNLTGPVNIWINEENVLHVIDWTEGSVKQFDTDLNYLRTHITGMTNSEGYLIDGDVVYICDWKDSKVEAFNLSSGVFIRTVVNSVHIQEANGITYGPDHRPQ